MFTSRHGQSIPDVLQKTLDPLRGVNYVSGMASKLGSRLQKLLDEKDVTTEALASAMGIEAGTLTKILSGEIETPPEHRIEAAAKILSVSVESLQGLISEGNKERQRNGNEGDDEHMARVYESEHHDRGLLVRNVELMTTLKQADRSELQQDIGEVWLQAAIERFEKDKTEDRLPKLYRGHNTKKKAAPVIGRIDALRLQNNWLVGDMFLTEPKAIEQFKRGEMPSRSAEFSPGRNFFKGLSLLEGHEGHFDSKLPELKPEALLLSADEDSLTVTLNRPIDLKETEMSLTKEDIVKLVAEEVAKGVAKALAEHKPAKTGTGDIEVEMKLAIDKIKADAKEEVDKFRREAEIDTYVVALTREGSIFTGNQLRRLFEKMETAEGRKEKFNRLMNMKASDVTLEIESGPTASVEGQLRLEYQAKAEHWKSKGVSEDEYVRLNSDESVTADLIRA